MLRRAGVGSQNVDGADGEERFEILPHPQVLGFMRKKTENYSRWIAGMAKLMRSLKEAKHR